MSKKKKDKKCRECRWSIYLDNDLALASGYICYLNPFNPVAMGLNGKHSKRKNHIQQSKNL